MYLGQGIGCLEDVSRGQALLDDDRRFRPKADLGHVIVRCGAAFPKPPLVDLPAFLVRGWQQWGTEPPLALMKDYGDHGAIQIFVNIPPNQNPERSSGPVPKLFASPSSCMVCVFLIETKHAKRRANWPALRFSAYSRRSVLTRMCSHSGIWYSWIYSTTARASSAACVYASNVPDAL